MEPTEDPFIDLTVRTRRVAEVNVEPDGTVEMTWGYLTILLSSDEAADLSAKLMSATLVGAPTVTQEAPA
jgi:hypothetical protein